MRLYLPIMLNVCFWPQVPHQSYKTRFIKIYRNQGPLKTKCALSKVIQDFQICNLLNTWNIMATWLILFLAILDLTQKSQTNCTWSLLGKESIYKCRFLVFYNFQTGLNHYMFNQKDEGFPTWCVYKNRFMKKKTFIKVSNVYSFIILNEGNMKPRDVLSISVHCTCF